MTRIPAMPDGTLHLRLQTGVERCKATLDSERPVLASRVFEGKPLHQVLLLVPLLFNVCGHAQSVAAVRAAERALHREPSQAVEQQRDVLLALEILREHLWRFFIDWPACLGMRGDAAAFAPFNRQLLELASELNPDRYLTAAPVPHATELPDTFVARWKHLGPALRRAVFGDEHAANTLDTLPSNSAAALLIATVCQGGYADIGATRISPLPPLADTELQNILAGQAAESFVRYPQWGGQCHETGPYARQSLHPLTRSIQARYGDGVAARMAARLAEIATMCERIDACVAGASLFRTASGSDSTASAGIAQVEAARGRLLHYLQLDGDTVTRYRIVAPTEWNFHPEGVLLDMLGGLHSQGEDLLTQARLLVCLVDPCVSCRVSAGNGLSSHPASPVRELSDA